MSWDGNICSLLISIRLIRAAVLSGGIILANNRFNGPLKGLHDGLV
jgi:hypothetical protein